MSDSLRRRLDDVPRKPLAMRGEGVRNSLADQQGKRAFGAVVARAISLANTTPKDVAFRLGYQDQSAVSRWIAGTETAHVCKLWALVDLRRALIEALAEADSGSRVRTVIDVERRRA